MCRVALGLLLGCHPPDVPALDPVEPPTVVLLLTIDTLHSGFLGMNHDWNTTPNLDALFAESTVLSTVTSVRGVSSPAMASFLTGVYPRKHKVRVNQALPDPRYLYLQSRFHSAGYRTYGFSSNQCDNIDVGIDVRMCTWTEEVGGLGDQRARDGLLVDALVAAIADHPADVPLFIWLHLLDPHEPYTAVEPWYTEFHPEPYTGSLDLSDDNALDAVAAGERTIDDADLAHIYATYASQVRAIDDQFGAVLDAVRARGWYDHALIISGVDHGETLFAHDNYPYHGCSYYNEVLDGVWSFRAPGQLPAGVVRSDRVSSVDVAPTVAELAGLTWTGDRDGQSLVSALVSGVAIHETVYLERGVNTAGIITDGLKYVLNPYQSYDDCAPFSYLSSTYTTPPVELFDLRADPTEQRNLADTAPEVAAPLHAQLCAWINDGPWDSPKNDVTNPLVRACR